MRFGITRSLRIGLGVSGRWIFLRWTEFVCFPGASRQAVRGACPRPSPWQGRSRANARKVQVRRLRAPDFPEKSGPPPRPPNSLRPGTHACEGSAQTCAREHVHVREAHIAGACMFEGAGVERLAIASAAAADRLTQASPTPAQSVDEELSGTVTADLYAS